jgi:hypothetical protein
MYRIMPATILLHFSGTKTAATISVVRHGFINYKIGYGFCLLLTEKLMHVALNYGTLGCTSKINCLNKISSQQLKKYVKITSNHLYGNARVCCSCP